MTDQGPTRPKSAEPSGWELKSDLSQLQDRLLSEVQILRERVTKLEELHTESLTFRRNIGVTVIASFLAAIGSLTVALVLHFVFS